jgi:hypothetical protein
MDLGASAFRVLSTPATKTCHWGPGLRNVGSRKPQAPQPSPLRVGDASQED